MHVQGEVGDLKSGCSAGRCEVKYLWEVKYNPKRRREGVFNVLHAGVLIFSGMIQSII